MWLSVTTVITFNRCPRNCPGYEVADVTPHAVSDCFKKSVSPHRHSLAREGCVQLPFWYSRGSGHPYLSTAYLSLVLVNVSRD